MSFSPQQSNLNLSDFGFVPQKKEKKNEFQDFGFSPEKEKLNAIESAGAGLLEGTIGLWEKLRQEVKQGKEVIGKFAFGEDFEEPTGPTTKSGEFLQEKYKDLTEFTQNLPESETQTGRRLRIAGQALPISATGGIPGIISGLVGSQAGQTVREVFGNEGKFEEFGIGEASAMVTDFLFGGLTAYGKSIYNQGKNTAKTPNNQIFREPENLLQKKVAQSAFQGEEKALNKIINDFSDAQLRTFEEEAIKLSPQRFSEITDSSASALQKNADDMFRNAQLDVISPIRATPDQAGTALQQSANEIFNQEVIKGERTAYNFAKKEAEGLSGQAPRTLNRAKALREELTKNQPTPEQKGTINFLDNLIADLETTTPATKTEASNILDAQGNPVFKATETPAKSEPTIKTANDLIDLVQKSNQAVNYESELRLQSHRLKPVVDSLREELGNILSTKQSARVALQDANNLHARNAEIWGTKYMRNMRFTENPESIISATEKASNMRNLKQAIQDPVIQSIGERAVVSKMTQAGSAKSSRNALDKLSPELNLVSRNSAEQLIQAKDPLTSIGGRIALRNSILKDVASSINTGKSPNRILELMDNPKGYHMVRESLNASQNGRQVFKSLERMYLEDTMTSLMDKSGQIDFSKAKDIFSNPGKRQVLQNMGGNNLVTRFKALENASNNFEKNLGLYSKPEAQTLFQSIVKEGKNAAITGSILRAFHVPWPVIGGLGLVKYTGKVGGIAFKNLQQKVLSNPKLVHYLEQLSLSDSVKDLSEQLPRFIKELEKLED